MNFLFRLISDFICSNLIYKKHFKKMIERIRNEKLDKKIFIFRSNDKTFNNMNCLSFIYILLHKKIIREYGSLDYSSYEVFKEKYLKNIRKEDVREGDIFFCFNNFKTEFHTGFIKNRISSNKLVVFSKYGSGYYFIEELLDDTDYPKDIVEFYTFTKIERNFTSASLEYFIKYNLEEIKIE